MKIVIDIPEETYKMCMNNNFGAEILKAVKNGTPLPKGHGDLIDTNEIKWYGCTTESDCPYKDRACKDCFRAECSKTQVDDIRPIIEADKAEGSGQE